jgi:tape measure domain-containing protein
MEGGDFRMSGVDERIVRLTFDNKQFEQGISTTLTSLDKLNKGLKFDGATKGLDDLSAASSKFSLGHISDGVDAIANKFKTMSIVAITALQNIANRAVDAGVNLVKSLTVSPITDGLHEYETNLNSIQTILANTQWEHTSLEQVNAALAKLNHYSDQTIYNFSEMARNIGTFTAAGVKLDVATDAIKGIANLAAISGSNAEQASTAMYQLSQALAAGKVTLMDWNSVVNAGMGGKVFQDSLMETARIHGVAIDKMVKDAGGFRNTLEKGWLTSGILTETLAKFTGDLNASQLKTMGYNDKQIQGILEMGKTAQEAATKVKTMSQLIDTLKEAVGSGWAQTWQSLFGDFEEARTMFTDVNNVLGGFIQTSSDARNKVIGDWKELGGRTVLIQAISNAFHALIDVIKPIREAFRSVFPATTGKQLFAMTVALEQFTEKLKIGSDTADRLKRIFSGVFSVLGIGWDIAKELAKVIFDLFGKATKSSGGFLEFAARVGDFVTQLRKAIEQGNVIHKVFAKIESALQKPIELVKALARHLKELFGGVDFSGTDAAKGLTGLVAKLAPLTHLGDSVAGAWDKVVKVLKDVWSVFEPLAKKVGGIFKDFGNGIKDAFDNIDYSTILKGVQTGLFAGLLLLVHQFVSKMSGGGLGGGLGGILDSVKESIEALTNTFGAMQNTLRAATLLEIALAVGVLAISLTVLSKIDGKALLRSTIVIGQMFTMLLGSMAVMAEIMKSGTFAKMPLLAAAMIPLALAIDILASAVKKLSTLDWNGLAKGLTGVVVLLGALVGVMRLMPPSSGLISTGLGLVVLAGAIKLLAISVTDLSGLSWSELAKGLTGVAALLGALTLFTMFAKANATGVLGGAGIVLLAAGIRILVGAVKDFGQMSWTEIGKGLAAVAGSLTLIGAALYAIPPTAPLSAAGVVIVAAALGLIGDAIAKMGAMHGKEIAKGVLAIGGALTFIAAALAVLPPTSLLSAAAILVVAASLGMITEALGTMGNMTKKEIGKSLIELAGALGIIAGAMFLMVEALPGAAALLVVTAALMGLTPVLQVFSQMSWEEMGKGLLMLAGIFTVLGIAGLVLTPLVPVLIGLGAAILLMGVGAAAAGVGVFLFAAGLTALAAAGTAGAAAIVAIVAGLIGLIPLVMEEIGKGIVAFAEVIANAGPAITNAITTVILALCDAIIKTIPKVVETLLKLLTMMLDTLNKYVPHLVQAGFDLLLAVLRGIRDNIGQVATVTLQILAAWINGIAAGLPGVIQAGVNLILSFINGITDAINNNAEELGRAGGRLAVAIIKGMVNGLKAGAGEIIKAAKNVASDALQAAKDFLDINSPSRKFMELGKSASEGMAVGFYKNQDMVTTASTDVAKASLDAIRKKMSSTAGLVGGVIDVQPVIKPIVDLSGVQKAADRIPVMFTPSPLSLDTTTSGAINAGKGFASDPLLGSEFGNTQPTSVITYNQYNNSPKALSEAEIYRGTKNQLSTLKGALPV